MAKTNSLFTHLLMFAAGFLSYHVATTYDGSIQRNTKIPRSSEIVFSNRVFTTKTIITDPERYKAYGPLDFQVELTTRLGELETQTSYPELKPIFEQLHALHLFELSQLYRVINSSSGKTNLASEIDSFFQSKYRE